MAHGKIGSKAKGSEAGFRLTDQQRSLWAKTNMNNDEQRGFWSPLYVHMADSANIARYLWNEWLPISERRFIADSVGGDDATAEALTVWLAGIHDIGKATPNFQCKVSDRAEVVREMGLEVPSPQMMHGRSHPHAFMSEVILDKWLSGRGWEYPSTYSCIVGGHHGVPPSNEELKDIRLKSCNSSNEVLGDDEWQSVQNDLLDWMLTYSGMSKCEQTLSSLGLTQPVEVLLTGIVIMADWIASNTDFFPLSNGPVGVNELYVRADFAWKQLALPSAWRASELVLDESDGVERLFHERFVGLPREAHLRSAQVAAVQAACSMDEPGLIIIEAPMGNGKTEASLLCAEILMRKFGNGGIAYLLPTMATSNAMFTRVEKWLELLVQTCDSSSQTMQLLHSKAALNPDYVHLKRWKSSWMGDTGQFGEEERVIAHQWFGGRKRGLLASFVVGTVDQLLMAALKTRHVQLRHLGLAGKVVVIDEVHAYDAYMSTYLRRVLVWLGAYGAPTILLSATLPPERRKELMHAYRGRDKSSRGRASKRRDLQEAPRNSIGQPAYPLVTSLVCDKEVPPTYAACSIDDMGINVHLDFLSDDDETLVQVLSGLLSDGGCACVLRNTVARAQATYRMLEEHLGKELSSAKIRLVHSRFIAADRLRNDADLLALLGPDASKRPEKLIVVGTQVMEQSLDIDFDVMFTDIAPIDLLLQRMGRLHRHTRGEKQCERPIGLRRAHCYIVGVEDWRVDPPAFSQGISSVYPEALLLRTILALQSRGDAGEHVVVNLPHDIADLVEYVYTFNGEDENSASSSAIVVPDTWKSKFDEAQEKLQQKQTIAVSRAETWLLGQPQFQNSRGLLGWLRESLKMVDESIGMATVRDSRESIEVVAIQERDKSLYIFPWVKNADGSEPTSRLLSNGEEAFDDDVARLAAACTVNLPSELSNDKNTEDLIHALETRCQIPGWQDSRWLKGQLVLVFDEFGEATIDTGIVVHHLKYSQSTGLKLIDTKKGERE